MRKGKNKLILLLLSFLCCSFFVQSQNRNEQYKTDTLSFNKKRMIIAVPLNSIKYQQGYEEGSFVTYTIQTDSVVITVHYGSMVSKPFIQNSNCVILNDLNINKGKYTINKRIGYSTKIDNNSFFKQIGYFREDSYKGYSITVMYENASKSQVSKYDSILDKVQIETVE